MKGLIFTNDAQTHIHKYITSLLKTGAQDNDGCELEIINSWGRVQKNNRYGREIRFAQRTFTRGLCCHAPTVMRVHSDKPVERFHAVVGISDMLARDAKDLYNSGPLWPKARIIVSDFNGKILYFSDVIGGGTAVEIDFNAGGVHELEITVSGATLQADGEFKPEMWSGIAGSVGSGAIHEWCDISIADVKLIFADGGERYLDEMTMTFGLLPMTDGLPFDFTYGGHRFSQICAAWKREENTVPVSGNRLRHVITFTDGATLLEVRFEAIEYTSHPAVEWTLYFKNSGSENTPIIEDINALDIILKRGESAEYKLHYNLGGICRFDDYRPFEETLPTNATKRLATLTGFGSDPYLPFFNIEDGAGEGLICAVGWAGQWACEFNRDDAAGLRITAGQETTHFYLEAGEEVRSSLIVIMPWRGDFAGAQNQWRHWMVEWGVPHTNGKLPTLGITASDDNVVGFGSQSEQNALEFLRGYEEQGIKLTSWWTDYAWHSLDTPTDLWISAPDRFPNGLRAVNDYCKARDMTSIVWLAPECRFFGGHSEWVIDGTIDEPLARGGKVSVIDFGNDEALHWLIEAHDAVIKREGIDIYRIDSGMGILPVWRKKDSADRLGISEIRYVTGYLKFLYELTVRNPGLQIDNCCRGGRRLDIEDCRLSYPLWRSDHCGTPVSNQMQTYGLAMWIPYFGTSAFGCDVYNFRSSMCPSTTFSYDDTRNKSLDYDTMRKNVSEFYEVCDDFYGNYYTLTPYNCEDSGWMAYEFFTPERGSGFIQVFRRAEIVADEPEADAMYFKLCGLDADAIYTVTDFDSGNTEYSGAELMKKGLHVSACYNTAKLFKIFVKAN